MRISPKRIGILGGGQLGKMMALAAGNWHMPVAILDRDRDYPAGPWATPFVCGDFKIKDEVYTFGKKMDVLTYEIEQVNLEALYSLEEEGISVYPRASTLKIIQDKGIQKTFYQEKHIPTAPFQLYGNKEAIQQAIQKGTLSVPFVQKTRKDGYDGRGVTVIREERDLTHLLEGPCVVEKTIAIRQEISILVARSVSGAICTYEPVEQFFDPLTNLVSYLICPAQAEASVLQTMDRIARQLAIELNLTGLLAVEFFVDAKGDVYVNEVAPRPHNSGHHTQNSCDTSQFEQHLRAIMDLPLGSVRQHSVGAMVNLIGEPGHAGPARFLGLDECLALPGVHVHLYGKKETRPGRKMGHINICQHDREEVLEKMTLVREVAKVVT